MQIGFRTMALKALCNSRQKLHKAFGPDAPVVRLTLFSLDAAPTLADISHSPPLSRRLLNDKNPPTFSVGGHGLCEILFLPDTNPLTSNPAEINQIRIIQVGGAV